MGRRKRAIRVFGFPDIHWGERDEQALAVAEKAHAAFEPDITVIGGDLLDCGPFSRFPASSMAEGVGDDWLHTELLPAQAWLDTIQARTKRTTVMLEGNHENRVERVCADGGKALRAMWPMVSPRRNLSRTKEGQPRKSFIYVPWVSEEKHGPGSGKYDLSPTLTTVHGWATTKYSARRHLEISRTQSVIFHHTHRVDSVTLKDNWNGNLITASGTGCLCKLRPLYAHGGKPTEWCHAFWVAFISQRHPDNHVHYVIPVGPHGAIMPDGTEIKL